MTTIVRCSPRDVYFIKWSVPEVVGSIFLAKATSRHEADPRLLEHLHAVKHIWLLTVVLAERKRNIAPFEASYSGGMGLFQVESI